MRVPWRVLSRAGPERSFRFCEGGVAAIEFVLVFPLLIGLLVAGNELARFIRARQQLNDYAGMVAYDIAGATSDVSVNTLAEMIRRFGLVAPELVDSTKDPWPSRTNRTPYFAVGVTMVEMVLLDPLCNASERACSYTPRVRWSFGTRQRACVDLTKRVGVGRPVTLGDLPEGAFQPNAVVVVDVSVPYNPIFPSGFKLGAIGYEFDLTAINTLLKKTYVAESWQSVRNWPATTRFPGLNGTSAGGWSGVRCP